MGNRDAFSLPFDEPADVTMARARALGVMLPADYYRLPANKRAQAYTVSGLARLDQIQLVADKFAAMQAQGSTFAEFKKWAKTQDWNLPAHRLDTIYRNAVQTAYMAGHWRSFEENADVLPYLMYDSINDSRTRPSHLALDGVIKPVGDAWWKTHSPPLGHRCRCSIRQISRKEAQERGGATQHVPAEGQADPGWGADPREWGKTLGRLVRERMDSCSINADASFAKKHIGPRIQCLPAGMIQLFRARAAEYQAMPLPEPKPMPRDLLIDPSHYKQHALERLFEQAYDADRVSRWTDSIGVVLTPDKSLFLKQGGNWKITKNQRAGYMLAFADTMADPATVQWIEGATTNAPDVLSIFGRYVIGGELHHTVVSFKWTGRSWDGWTAYKLRPELWEAYSSDGVPIWRRQ